MYGKQTRMTTFINAKLKKPDYKTNIDKYRVFIISYHIEINLFYHFKIHKDKVFISCKICNVKMSKINMFKMDLRIFDQNLGAATLSTFFLQVSGSIIQNSK